MKTTLGNQDYPGLRSQTQDLNEDPAPPSKPFAHRFCSYLVLFSFFLQTTVPVLAMDAGAKHPQELRREYGRLYVNGDEMTLNPAKGDKSVIVTAYLANGESEDFDGVIIEPTRTSTNADVVLKKSSPLKTKPELNNIGSTHEKDYARWVRETVQWVQNLEIIPTFSVNVRYKGQDIFVEDITFKGASLVGLIPEVSLEKTLDEDTADQITTLLIKGLVTKGLVASKEFRCPLSYKVHRAEPTPSNSPGKISRRGMDLFVPGERLVVYERPAVSGVPGLERSHLFPQKTEFVQEGEKNLQSKAYKLTPRPGKPEEDLFVDGIFAFDTQKYQSSPYLYKDEDTFYLTRTVTSSQENGEMEHTAQTPIQIKAILTESPDNKDLPMRGLFERDRKKWAALGQFYRRDPAKGRYQWDFGDVTVSGGMKQTQFLLDINHAQEVLNLETTKLILTVPFATEEVIEFSRIEDKPTTLPNFQILESAIYPPFSLPNSLVALTLKGTALAPLALNAEQARHIGSLSKLRTFGLKNIAISDADLAVALGSNSLKYLSLKAIPLMGQTTMRRLVALSQLIDPGSGQQSLTSLAVSDKADLTDLFYVTFPNLNNTHAAQKASMVRFLDPAANTPQSALALAEGIKVSDPTKARKYYRIAACQENTVDSKEAAYRLALLLRQSDIVQALSFFDRAAGDDFRGHWLAALEAGKIHEAGSRTPWIYQYTSRAKNIFKAVADHAPSSQEAAKREATLLFADLSRKGSTAEEIEAREYYQKLDSGYVGRGDPFKGKALLAHGQMFLEGEGGDADYDAALSKLNDARRFTNVKEKASEEWGRARFEKARDLLYKKGSARHGQKIWDWVSEPEEVITLYPPAKVIQGWLWAEERAPDQKGRHISIEDIGKAIRLSKEVLDDPLAQHNKTALAMSHHILGYRHKEAITVHSNERGMCGWRFSFSVPDAKYVNLTKALHHNLEASRLNHDLSKLWFGELLWEAYKESSDKALIRRVLMVAEWHVCFVGHKSKDEDLKEKAVVIATKLNEAFTANGFKVPSWFDFPDAEAVDALVAGAQEEKNKQAAEAQARAAADGFRDEY